MRILHLLSQTELTGAEVYAQNLIQFQVQAGHQVNVVSDRIHIKLPVAWTSLSLSTKSAWQRFKNIWALRQLLKKEKIEVIHCHSRGAVRHAYWARWGLPVALVTTLHGRQHFSWSKRFLDIYGELRIAICENLKIAMQKDFQQPGSNIRILRNPVDSGPVEKTPGIESNPLHIALLGRSSGPKGERFEQIALHSFENWLLRSPGLRLSIIAPKPERFSQELQNLIIRLNQKFPHQLEILGHIPDLRDRLTEFDLCLCSGRIAIESLLAKVPVLAVGEHSSPGLVTMKNFDECLASNFGDIGASELEVLLDLKKIDDTVASFLTGPRPSDSDLQKIKEKIFHEFNSQTINQSVLEIYRAAQFKRHVPHWIPILMYHKIPDSELTSRHRIFVTRKNFEKHLRFFKWRKFQTLNFQDLKKFFDGQKPYSEFPKKPLLLTFDDGYTDNLFNAQPLLKKYGFQAVIYLLGNHQIVENSWDADTGEKPYQLMSLEQKKQLDPNVWEIGSHGFDHLHLTQVSDDLAFHEMLASRLSLGKDFGQEILSFAYPFGSTDERLRHLAEKAGYRFAVNTDQGGLHLSDQPWSLFRVNIFPEDSYLEIWKKTAPWYRSYFFRKRHR